MSGHSDLGIFNNLEHLQFFFGISRYCICCLSIATRQSGDDIHDFSSVITVLQEVEEVQEGLQEIEE